MLQYSLLLKNRRNNLNDTDNKSSILATRKLYDINDQNNIEYGEGNENDSSIKFETKVIKSSLCHYSDAYILVIWDITVGKANTYVAFKNCAPFTTCVTHLMINSLILLKILIL